MDFKLVLRLTKIFTLSTSRTQKTQTRLNRRPFPNLYISFALFAVVAFIVYIKVNGIDPLLLGVLYGQAVVFLPSLTVFASMMYSLMFELNQTSRAASVDIINWLPIRPGDYVFASALTTLYYISPITSIIVGASTGVAACTGAYGLWAFSFFLTLVGSFLGAFTLEIAKALMNRTSRMLKGRGRAVMYFRLLLYLVVMGSFYVIYNIDTMLGIMRVFSGNITGAWFVPFLWPSLATLSLLSGEIFWVLGYSILSLALTAAVFVTSSHVRARYWAPAPVSYKIGSTVKRGGSRGLLGWLGFSQPEIAVIRKDLRSIVRRSELQTFILMPIVLSVLFFIQGDFSELFDPELSLLSRSVKFSATVVLPSILTLFISMTSVGQEDESFYLLRVLPLSARQIVGAKLAASLIPSAPFYIGILLAHVFLIRSTWDIVAMFAVIGFMILLDLALAGLVSSAVFPSFKELRYRTGGFFTIQGMLLNYFIAGLTGLVIITPILDSFMGFILGLDLIYAATISTAIAVLTSYTLLRVAEHYVAKLLEEDL